MKVKWKTKYLNEGAGFSLRSFMVTDTFALISGTSAVVNGVENKILKVDLSTGNYSDYLILDSLDTNAPLDFFIYRSSNNGPINLITKNFEQELIGYSDSQLSWKVNNISDGFFKLIYKKAADFNQDGSTEIYTGNSIVNNNGRLLFKGNSSEGCNFASGFNECFLGAFSIASDFTDHNGLELACGNVVYEVNLINTVDSVGNTAKVITAPPEVLEGYTAMGDFDGDGRLEVVSSRGNGNNDGGVWIWNPRDVSVLASSIHPSSVGGWGGVPTIADVDNDCVPEVVVIYENVLKVYTYDGTSELKVLHERTIIDDSGYTIPTVFDLNSDGINEIIYRDEEYLFILDGPSGMTLDSFPLMSPTRNEQPIVTDGDGDGHAEILIQGSDDDADSLRLFCFESANRPWAPARRVWNQTGYHVTNVNDDLTIPQYQQNSAAFFDTDSCYLETCPQVYNTFGVQATFRTQKGCEVLPERELDPVEIVASQDTICAGDNVTLSIDAEENEVLWYIPGLSSCTDCDSLTVSLDTTLWISVIVGDDRCFVEDSILIYVTQPIERPQTESICEGDSVIIENLVFTEEGSYPINTLSSMGCDSIIELTVVHYPSSMLDSTITICDGDSVLIDDVWYDESDFVAIQETNSFGCDSTVMMTIELVDILGDQDTIRICEGDSTMLHGQWQSQAGDYPELFTSVRGCDSVYTYHLMIKDTAVIYLHEAICDGDTFFINGDTLVEPMMYEYTLPSSLLCDSTINVNLMVSAALEETQYISICEGDSVFLSGMWIYDDGEVEVMKPNDDVCDSILTYVISVADYLIDDQAISSCEGDSILLDGILFTNDTLLIDTISGIDCPTIRSVDISFVSLSSTFIDTVFCQADNFITSMDTLSNDGIATEVFQASSGCDSVVTYDVTFIARNIQDSYIYICEGDSIFLSDRYYYDDTIFVDISAGPMCDTVHIYNLTVFDSDTTYHSYSILEGESINIDGGEYTAAGEYQNTVSNIAGCDSVLFINITEEETNELIVPNIFSPNGDNLNDDFALELQEYLGNELRIFDRWGNTVFSAINQSRPTWDGRWNNRAVGHGVYVYVLTYINANGETCVKAGDITVVR